MCPTRIRDKKMGLAFPTGSTYFRLPNCEFCGESLTWNPAGGFYCLNSACKEKKAHLVRERELLSKDYKCAWCGIFFKQLGSTALFNKTRFCSRKCEVEYR